MPELPEVESTVARMRAELLGHNVLEVQVLWPRSVHCPGLNRFRKQLLGCRFEQATRRGKFIVLHLIGSAGDLKYVLVHLRMSGKLNVRHSSLEREKHDRVIMTLDRDRELRFTDTRKFGRLYLVDDPGEIVGKLGPEPLSSEFRSSDFCGLLDSRSAVIKPLLLNQEFIAGLGNIYVDEALWRAGVHPLRRSNSLTKNEGQQLYRSIRSVLRQAIKAQGTDFGDNVIRGGDYRPRVYGRDGEDCFRCGEAIEKIIVAQRGTHLCPHCQT